jgi:hypothetical protein
MDPEVIQIIEMLAAIVVAIVAYWQHRQKTAADEATEEAVAGMNVAKAQLSEAEAGRDDVVSFFDPGDERVTEPPANVPARSWKMNDETKRWVNAGHSPDEQASLLKQIAEAEEQKKYHYFISVPGAFYEIEYGLLKGGGKG